MITGKDVLDDEDLRTFSVKIEGKLVKVDGIFTGNSAKFIMLADIPEWLFYRGYRAASLINYLLGS